MVNPRGIVFQALNEVECVAEEKEIRPDRDGVVIETHYSCNSAGTETAKLTGLQPFDFPSGLGNRAIGRVVETGPECEEFAVGDLVFSHIYHVSHAKGAHEWKTPMYPDGFHKITMLRSKVVRKIHLKRYQHARRHSTESPRHSIQRYEREKRKTHHRRHLQTSILRLGGIVLQDHIMSLDNLVALGADSTHMKIVDLR